jgi:hypothetical protein
MGDPIVDLYDASAAIGRAFSMIEAIVITIIALILIVIAIYMLPSDTQQETATVTSVNSCTPVLNSYGHPTSIYNCSLQISYSYKGTNYVTPFSTTGIAYNVNDTIQIGINPKNPKQFELASQVPGKVVPMVLIGISVFATAMVWLFYYLTNKSKLYAAITGISDVAAVLDS